MWLLFFVVVLVLSLLMVFLIMAIRMLATQARQQLNRYFLKNLETYDRLAENKSARIEELQSQIRELEERAADVKAQTEAMKAVSGQRPAGPVAVAAPETVPSASYRDAGFLEDYAYVRQHMKLDYRKQVRDILQKLKEEKDPMLLLCRDMLDKIPMDYLYEIITMQETDQIEYLKELFDDEEDAFLDRYAQEQGCFDLLAFHNYLTNYVRGHEHEVYIHTGNPEEYADMETDHVHVKYDPGVHEGVRVSYQNTLYDFSL